MKAYFTLLLFLLPFLNFAQLKFDKVSYDFGEINKADIRYVDFTLSNPSTKTIYLLRADLDRELSIRYSKKNIEPDSLAVVRIQYNPKQLGAFNKKIPLYISSSPDAIILTIKGEVTYLEENSSTDCPDFSYNKPASPLQFDLQVQVIDTVTGLPIQHASVLLLKSGLAVKTFLTNEKGIAESLVQIGLYYVVVEASRYDTKELSVYLNRQHNNLVIYLQPIPSFITVIDTNKINPSELVVSQPMQATTYLAISDSIRKIAAVQLVVEKVPDSTLITTLSGDYAPNNIVFLIDVSTSMLNQGKLDLLKASMIQLLQPLRDIDKISIVTYASSVTIPLQTTAASNKEDISQIIQQLEGGGLTAGDKGIAKAYEICMQSYIPNGNNQIILATDGVFTVDQRTTNLIEQNVIKDIILSVVGIKNSHQSASSMKKIAEQGHGHYFQINNYNDAKSCLIEEIKANSLQK